MVFNKGIVHSLKYGELGDQDDEEVAQVRMWFVRQRKNERNVKYKFKRITWEDHLEMLRHTDGFGTRYHVSEEGFDRLVILLARDITIDVIKSKASTRGNDPIYPELVVGSGLRFLGGEYPKSIADIYGLSIKSVERIVQLFLHATMASPELEIRLPTTDEELSKCMNEWLEHSSAGDIFYGFVGAIDGWLCCTEMPANVDNQGDYYSGHYQRYGLNVQCVCDANLRFLYFCVVAPGKCNDARAFMRCERLNTWLNNLPSDVFLGGDNAYPLSDTMMIPFSGTEKFEPLKRTFNYYLSQLRIRVEMTFGLFTTKWRIFRRNLDFSLEKNIQICKVAARLHNFIIDYDGLNYNNIRSGDHEAINATPLLEGPNNNWGYLESLPQRNTNRTNTTHQQAGKERRDKMLQKIEEYEVQRPQHNIDRNNQWDAATVYEEEDGDEVPGFELED